MHSPWASERHRRCCRCAAKALFNVRNVVAAPQSDCRNARRPSPTRLAFSPIRSSASLLARATCSVSGTGRNSPLDVASTLTGSGPLISFATALTLLSCRPLGSMRASARHRDGMLSHAPCDVTLRTKLKSRHSYAVEIQVYLAEPTSFSPDRATPDLWQRQNCAQKVPQSQRWPSIVLFGRSSRRGRRSASCCRAPRRSSPTR